jgi:hypothetical protein
MKYFFEHSRDVARPSWPCSHWLEARAAGKKQSGIVLLVTLVLLVVLATLGYTLSSRVAARRHRDQYIIDYSKARYGCDSALKYALATVEDISPQLISRPNEPDFSDLFILSEAEYQKLLAQWAAEKALDTEDGLTGINSADLGEKLVDFNDVNDVNDIDLSKMKSVNLADTASVTIPGPYGQEWPYLTEPAEFEIGSTKVRIEIEDENAKYPIGWALLSDNQVQREAQAGFEIFCEWMGFDRSDIDSLKAQLNQIGEMKPFKLEFEPVKTTVRIPSTTSRTTRITNRTISAADQTARQNTDLARLLHSSLIDRESLARPYIEGRKESALKYLGMWASRTVNINTAPRHVLEAAFAFGSPSDAPAIADAVIQRRRVEPFIDLDSLKQLLPRYSDSIRRCEKYITTVSEFFTIRVTAISGVAKASAVAAVTKEQGRTKVVAVISG